MQKTYEKRFRMKKLFALLLVFLMIFSFAACGGDDTPDADGTGTGTEVSGSEDGNADGEGTDGEGGDDTIGAGDTLNPDDLHMSDGQDYALEAEYDFEYSYTADFGMSSFLKKLDYSDYEAMEAELQSRMEKSIAATVGGSYEVFTSYEPDEESEIDELTCAAAMEDGDTAGIYFEGGAYHVVGDANYQYINCFSRNYSEISDANTKEILELAKKTLGLEMNKKNLKKAIEQVFETANTNKDEFTLMEEAYNGGEGFDEIIRIAMVGAVTEENEVSYYAYFERERCYE